MFSHGVGKTVARFFCYTIEDQDLAKKVEFNIARINYRNLRFFHILAMLVVIIQLILDFATQDLWHQQQSRFFLLADGAFLIFLLLCGVLFMTQKSVKSFIRKSGFRNAYLFAVLIWAATISGVETMTKDSSLTFVFAAVIVSILWIHRIEHIAFLLTVSCSYRIILSSFSLHQNNYILSVIPLWSVVLLVLLVLTRQTYIEKMRSLKNEILLKDALKTKSKHSKEKTDFVQNLSHELRTPLTGILGFSDAIHQNAEDEGTQQYSRLISSEGRKLLTLINRLLDISKIEAGKLEIRQEPFPFRSVIEDFGESYARRAKLKGLDFFFTLDNNIPRGLIGDEERVLQILANLTGNALKFTEKGSVSLHISHQSQNEKGHSILFEISDTGIGISKDRIDRIFHPFEQADQGISKTFGGTGLGTTISKQLVELMGGEIDVISLPGRGSTFRFTLELEEAQGFNLPTHNKGIPVVSQLHGKRILIVEDYEINQKIATLFLEKEGALVQIAENGKECLTTLEKQSFDLILLDVQMPVMDGIETIKHIRKDENLKDYLVLGLTADAYEEDRRNFMAHGMDEVIRKPFSRTSLIRKISEHLSKRVS